MNGPTLCQFIGLPRFVVSLALPLLCFFVGCDSTVTESGDDAPSVSIQYQGKPLADVMVRLHGVDDGPVLAQAITGNDGNARFSTLPSPEPAKFFVSLESISDGGWILDSRVIERSGVVLELSPFSNQSQQKLELPPRAVKPL